MWSQAPYNTMNWVNWLLVPDEPVEFEKKTTNGSSRLQENYQSFKRNDPVVYIYLKLVKKKKGNNM